MTAVWRRWLRGMWDALPASPRLKRRIAERALRPLELRLLPQAGDPALARPGPVVVAGYLSAGTGLGRGARMFAAALRECRVATEAVDLAGSPVSACAQRGAARRPPERDGPLLAVVNPPALPGALRRLGPRPLDGRYAIGHWTWELPALPTGWSRAQRSLHEMWVPSQFVLDAVRAAVDLPVRLVPYPVATLLPLRDDALAASKPASQPFTVLTMFDTHSSVARKNPLAAVRAFSAALGRAKDARLIVKAANADPTGSLWRELTTLAGSAGNISVLTERLSDDAVTALIARADVVLSLHRAEGFGLPLAEAMCLGRAVVATGWSGNMSFMTADNSLPVPCRILPAQDPQGIYDTAGQHWAEPDLDAAVEMLRRLYQDRDYCRTIGEKARSDISARFSAAAFWETVPSDLRVLMTAV
jgi:glycosyltransferase involved in cell wall biosynthesis